MLDPEDSAKLAAFLAGQRIEASDRAAAFESTTGVKNITPHGRVETRG